MTKKWILGGIALLSFLAAAETARAEPVEDARTAMRRGLAAMERGDAEAALVEYETAKRLVPAANAPYFHAAEALERLGRWKDAVANLETYLAKDATVSDAEDVRKRIAAIRAEHFPGRARVEANTSDALVSIDGGERRPVGTFELAPGTHRFDVTASGHLGVVREAAIAGDGEITLSFVLPLAPTAPARVAPASTARAGDAPAPSSPWRTIGVAVAAVGAAGAITSGIVDVAVLGPRTREYQTAADRLDPGARALRDDVESLRAGVLVGYIVGTTLLVGGVAMAWLAPRGSHTVADGAPLRVARILSGQLAF